MAFLGDLMDEILVEILEFLACDKASLCTLATVNKKFDGLVVQFLAREIDVQVQAQDEVLSRKYDSLMSSVLQSPHLFSSVRKVTVRCERSKTARGRPKKTLLKDPNSRANELLGVLSNIQSLVIDWDDPKFPFMPDYLQHINHPRLRDISFPGNETSLNVICGYLKLKSLSSMHINWLDPGSSLTRKNVQVWPAEHDGANLSFLNLGKAHLPHAELRKLLECASNISNLRCVAPGIEEPTHWKPDRPFRTKMTSNLSPALTAQAFSPLQTCLVELDLNDGSRTHWPGHDGTRMDMSRFSCLKVLDVPSTCFFIGFQSTQRRYVRALLPSSLKELNLWFDFDNHFLYTDPELPECFPDDQYNTRFDLQYADRYAWLLELAEANKEPNDSFCLRKIQIEERIKHPRGFSYNGFEWALPPFLQQLCDDAELRLDVSLRKPKVDGDGLN